MANILRGLADEIALGLAKELREPTIVPMPPASRPRDAFVDQVVQELMNRLGNVGMSTDQVVHELVNRLGNVGMSTSSEQQFLLQRLQQVESALEKVAARIRSGQEESQPRPDLHKERSKYQNVDSLLKYVDGSDADSGVKLVIMNFND